MNFIELNQFFYNKLNKEDEINKEDYQKLQQVKDTFSKKRLNHLDVQDTEGKLEEIFNNVDMDEGWQGKMLYGYGYRKFQKQSQARSVTSLKTKLETITRKL